MRLILILLFTFTTQALHAAPPDSLLVGRPAGSAASGEFTLVSLLARLESILLYGITPVVVIGAGLYIAYELFVAEGNEEKHKQAWKSLTYGSIGLICIALAYAAIRIILSLSL